MSGADRSAKQAGSARRRRSLRGYRLQPRTKHPASMASPPIAFAAAIQGVNFIIRWSPPVSAKEEVNKMTVTREIVARDWPEFLHVFSDQNQGRRVRLE